MRYLLNCLGFDVNLKTYAEQKVHDKIIMSKEEYIYHYEPNKLI